jgi:hypothetical protein
MHQHGCDLCTRTMPTHSRNSTSTHSGPRSKPAGATPSSVILKRRAAFTRTACGIVSDRGPVSHCDARRRVSGVAPPRALGPSRRKGDRDPRPDHASPARTSPLMMMRPTTPTVCAFHGFRSAYVFDAQTDGAHCRPSPATPPAIQVWSPRSFQMSCGISSNRSFPLHQVGRKADGRASLHRHSVCPRSGILWQNAPVRNSGVGRG